MYFAAGHSIRLLRALLSLSLLFLVAHLAFQIALHTVPSLDRLLGPNCELLGVGRKTGRWRAGLGWGASAADLDPGRAGPTQALPNRSCPQPGFMSSPGGPEDIFRE